jgi:hypothetical protein
MSVVIGWLVFFGGSAFLICLFVEEAHALYHERRDQRF